MDLTQAIASYRHQAYQFFTLFSMEAMNETLFDWVLSDEATNLFKVLRNQPDSSSCNEGFDLMADAASALRTASSDEQIVALNSLATDRTYLFRALAPGVGALPPYESYWAATSDAESVIITLKSIYRNEGLEVSTLSHERPDYLGVELAYMTVLTEDEANSSSHCSQTAFITNHLSTWVPQYVKSAKEFVSTKFYRGYLLALETFITWEKDYFTSLAAA